MGIQYVLGSWYKRTELGKRTAIFACTAYVGTAFGGYIFSGVHATMDGLQGLEAWRWNFIVDGTLTGRENAISASKRLLLMFYRLWSPFTALYSSQTRLKRQKLSTCQNAEKERCVERLAEDDRVPLGEWSRTIFKRILTSWQFYVLTVLWM